MSEPRKMRPWHHAHDLEAHMATLLTVGTSIALAIALLGVALHISRGEADPIDLHTFGRGVGSGFRGIQSIMRDAMKGDAMGVMALSVLVLVATPVARVFFTLVAFALVKDRLYTIVALVVLAGLALGLTGLVE